VQCILKDITNNNTERNKKEKEKKTVKTKQTVIELWLKPTNVSDGVTGL
jgi:hypothetical protein